MCIELIATHTYFHFQTIMSKYYWIFTKLGRCIDIVEICFWLLMGKFCQFMTELSVFHMSVFLFTKLGMCTDIMEIWVGIANG